MTALEKMTAKATVKKEVLEGITSVIKQKQEHMRYMENEMLEKMGEYNALDEETKSEYKSFEDYWQAVDRWDYKDWKETSEFLEVIDEVIKEMIK